MNNVDSALAVKLGARSVRHVRSPHHYDNSALLASCTGGGVVLLDLGQPEAQKNSIRSPFTAAESSADNQSAPVIVKDPCTGDRAGL